MQKYKKIKRLLIANRAEIATRLIRACRDLDICAVAIYSDVDRNALHVQLADEAYPLGGKTASESYLNQSRIMEIAKQAHVDAIHPGYGFLSENPDFADAVERAGLIFVGPSSTSMRLLGDKMEAKKLARRSKIPTVAGTAEAVTGEEEGLQHATELGFPVLLKAAAGGGGKGMRIVRSRNEFLPALRSARSEAKTAFGNETVYFEKYVQRPRHIEMQILADRHGNIIYLGERECSIQRRHQKVLEESPSPFLTAELRERMGRAAVKITKQARYSNAGTVEFLVDRDENYYFLEVNTRLQVEHPVTELLTGIDLVCEQIRIAEGEPLVFSQGKVKSQGHALECRVYAEDPSNNFFPSTGQLKMYCPPEGPGVRVDNGFRQGDMITMHYDPLLAKVITLGEDRSQAIKVMRRALSEFRVDGVETTVPFCLFVLNNKQFIEGNYDTNFVQKTFSVEKLKRDSEWKRIAAVVSAVLIHKDHGTNAVEWRPGSYDNRWKHKREEYYRT